MSRIDRSGLALFVAQGGVSEEFRQAFVEPEGQVAEIQAHQRVRILVVQRVKGILTLGIQPHHHVILVFARLVQPGVMDVALHFPFFRKKELHRVFVFGGHDDDGLAQVHAKAAEGAVKHLADLLELVRNFSCVFFPGVAVHGEVRASHFNPVIGRVGARS